MTNEEIFAAVARATGAPSFGGMRLTITAADCVPTEDGWRRFREELAKQLGPILRGKPVGGDDPP
jgi:hypothetical protein